MSGRNEDFFKDSEEKLLFLAGGQLIRQGNIGVTKDLALEIYNKRFNILDTSMDKLLDSLVQKSFVSKSNDIYYLTKIGEEKSIAILS